MAVVGRVRRNRQLGQGRFIARPGCGANPAARAYEKLGTLSVGSGVAASWDRAGLSPAQAAEQTRRRGPTESWGRCRPGQA
ncbi:TPA: hypothetical protein ACTW9A_003744 [Raoultella planticola]|uniref:hypothetical protein n=1 Tax=Raoultella planticola TaxID=575 RepID=UPI000FEB9B99|nr:hypothetical protein [Raoultella planticola]